MAGGRGWAESGCGQRCREAPSGDRAAKRTRVDTEKPVSFAFILPPVQGNVLNPPGQSRRTERREAAAGLGPEGGSPEERGDQESKPRGPGWAGLLETRRPSGRTELTCPSTVGARRQTNMY